MTIKRIDVSDQEWSRYISSRPEATIFHHPAWIQLLAECYGYGSFALVNLNPAGEVEAGMPFMDVNSRLTGHRWVSLPFSDHCMPLYRNEQALEGMVQYLIQQNQQKTIPKVDVHANLPVEEHVFHTTAYVWSKVELCADPEELLKTFDRTRVRQPIQQAARRGVEIRRAESKNDLYRFYTLFVKTHHRLGAPVQPKRFFTLVWNRLIEQGLGFLLLAYLHGQPIAGNLCLHYGNTLTLKYNASLPEYWKARANHLLYWSSIKWGCENGYKYFDFGRTNLNNLDLRRYKQGWAAEEAPLTYTTISDHPSKKLSQRSSDVLGFIIRRSPLFVCRALGEALYGHYA